MIQFFLQIPTQVIDKIPQDKQGMLVATVIALSGAIVWLALYIRSLHTKHMDIVLKNTETITKVTTQVTHTVENNTKATENLDRNIGNLNLTIRETMGKK